MLIDMFLHNPINCQGVNGVSQENGADEEGGNEDEKSHGCFFDKPPGFPTLTRLKTRYGSLLGRFFGKISRTFALQAPEHPVEGCLAVEARLHGNGQ
jgi:hypothetical protein